MKTNWLVAGVVFGCVGGAGLVACQSGGGGTGAGGGSGGNATSNPPTGSTTQPPTGSTTQTPTGSTTATDTFTTVTTTTSTGTGTGTGTTCSKVTTLHTPALDAGPGTIYCPFSGVDGGKAEYCTAGTQHCCETPAGSTTPSGCDPIATACITGSVDWHCEDPVADCTDPSKPVCCAPGASIGLGAPGCGNYAHHMTGTTCVAAGACTGIVMCTSNEECPMGQTCTPFGKAGNQVGGCM